MCLSGGAPATPLVSRQAHAPLSLLKLYLNKAQNTDKVNGECFAISNEKKLRKLIVNNYIVIYKDSLDNKEIQVVRVLYGMMDFENML